MIDIEQVIAELDTVTEMIWEATIRSHVTKVDVIPPDRQHGPTVGACVHILGGWYGSVSIECEYSLAQDIVCTMFQIPNQTVASEDWHSVLKELTNVTGGNIKGLLGDSCILSTPRAWEGHNFAFEVPDSVETLCRHYSILDKFFVVRIHESNLDLDGLP